MIINKTTHFGMITRSLCASRTRNFAKVSGFCFSTLKSPIHTLVRSRGYFCELLCSFSKARKITEPLKSPNPDRSDSWNATACPRGASRTSRAVEADRELWGKPHVRTPQCLRLQKSKRIKKVRQDDKCDYEASGPSSAEAPQDIGPWEKEGSDRDLFSTRLTATSGCLRRFHTTTTGHPPAGGAD